MARKIVIGLVALLSVAVLGFALYALFGIVSWSSLGKAQSVPTTKATSTVSRSSGEGASLATAIESDFTANEARADTAPKQQVVNGWAAKDAMRGLLTQTDTLAQQNADLGAQAADNTNLLLARLDSLAATVVALLAVIALMAVAGCLLLLAIAIAALWRDKPRTESAQGDFDVVAVEPQALQP